MKWTAPIGLCILLLFCFWLFSDHVVGLLYGEKTIYSASYNESGFSTIRIGDSVESIASRIGNPLKTTLANTREIWRYSPPQMTQKKSALSVFGNIIEIAPYGDLEQVASIEFTSDGRVSVARGGLPGDIDIGTTKQELVKRFGKPAEVLPEEKGTWFEYSMPENSTNKTHKVRRILINENGKATRIDKYLWVD